MDDAIWVRPLGSDDVVRVELEPEMLVDVGTLRLPAGVSTLPVSGAVMDASGAPVPGASVWVGIEPRLGFGSRAVRTDGGGEFELNVVAGLRYRLYAGRMVTVGGYRQWRQTQNSFDAVGPLRPFHLVLGDQ